MIRLAALLVMLTASAAVGGVAEDAAAASADLQAAVAGLQEAEGAKDRVAALTRTSTLLVRLEPSGVISRSSIARSSLA